MTKIFDEEGFLIASVELEKESVNRWTVVLRDGWGYVKRVEGGIEYLSACQIKREWIEEAKNA